MALPCRRMAAACPNRCSVPPSPPPLPSAPFVRAPQADPPLINMLPEADGRRPETQSICSLGATHRWVFALSWDIFPAYVTITHVSRSLCEQPWRTIPFYTFYYNTLAYAGIFFQSTDWIAAAHLLMQRSINTYIYHCTSANSSTILWTQHSMWSHSCIPNVCGIHT